MRTRNFWMVALLVTASASACAESNTGNETKGSTVKKDGVGGGAPRNVRARTGIGGWMTAYVSRLVLLVVVAVVGACGGNSPAGPSAPSQPGQSSQSSGSSQKKSGPSNTYASNLPGGQSLALDQAPDVLGKGAAGAGGSTDEAKLNAKEASASWDARFSQRRRVQFGQNADRELPPEYAQGVEGYFRRLAHEAAEK